MREDHAERLVGARAERVAEARDAGRIDAECGRECGIVRDIGQPRGDQAIVELVPLDLVRGQDRDQVVDIGGRRDERRERRAAVPAQRAPAAARAHRGPALDIESGLAELTVVLAEHDAADARHALGQPARAVRECREVRLGILGAEVEARPSVAMRLLERAHADIATRPQERVIRPDIEVDLVAGGPRLLAIHGDTLVDPRLRSAFLGLNLC